MGGLRTATVLAAKASGSALGILRREFFISEIVFVLFPEQDSHACPVLWQDFNGFTMALLERLCARVDVRLRLGLLPCLRDPCEVTFVAHSSFREVDPNAHGQHRVQ